MRNLPRELTKEDLKRYGDHLTVGRLKEILYELPNDALVLVERVEDTYFENNNWGVYYVEGMFCHQLREWNSKLAEGQITEEEYPKLFEEPNHQLLKPHTEEEIKQDCDQFHPAFCAVKDDNMLLIYQHY